MPLRSLVQPLALPLVSLPILFLFSTLPFLLFPVSLSRFPPVLSCSFVPFYSFFPFLPIPALSLPPPPLFRFFLSYLFPVPLVLSPAFFSLQPSFSDDPLSPFHSLDNLCGLSVPFRSFLPILPILPIRPFRSVPFPSSLPSNALPFFL
jgi:hypothetical protein